MTTPNTDNQEELARRIQRRILSETRQKLAETERKLEIVKEQIKRLANEVITKHNEMDEKIARAREQLILVDEKDHMIKMLQQRVENLNKEYNNRWGGRRTITLEDVYRSTGEADVRRLELANRKLKEYGHISESNDN